MEKTTARVARLPVAVVLGALVAAGWYFHGRASRCQLMIDQGAAAGGSDNAAVSPVIPLFPDAGTASALKLGYAPFEAKAGGWAVAVPLPPGSAMATLLAVDVAPGHKLNLEMLDQRCAAPVNFEVLRPDAVQPIKTGVLSAGAGRLAEVAPEESKQERWLVRIAMDAKAENNWFCNIGVSVPSVAGPR